MTLLLLGGGLLGLTRLEVREDIEAMLPDDGSRVAEDFRYLQQAPFARKVLIHLRGDARITSTSLLAAADRLAAALSPDYFSQPMTGPALLKNFRLPEWLTAMLPNLLDAEDLRRLAADLTPERVRERVDAGYRRMLSPEGWLAKGMLREDPLDLRNRGLEKLRFINPIDKARLYEGHFIGADGHSALIVADSPVPITDSHGAAALLADFERARGSLPAEVTASLVSGHRYTLANASAIKGDLATVLTLSSFAVLAIYLFFLRSWQGIFVFLVPAAILLIASGVIAFAYREVFAVTLGFGGVLLGIADEYAMHIYFACRGGNAPRAELVGKVAGPVSCGALATLASFAVLLVSSLPGQRQLAVYAMTGIVAALLLSLLVLPHLVRPASGGGLLRFSPFAGVRHLPRGWIIGTWLVTLTVSAVFAGGLRFNGELKAMSLTPAALLRDERLLQEAFGDVRGKAMLVVAGSDPETALARNAELFHFLRTRLPEAGILSLAPLLPSQADQLRNVRRWRTFWAGEEGRRILADLAAEGRRFGFSAGAFAPFLARLTTPPATVTPETLRQAGLAPVVDALLSRQGDQIRLLTLAPDSGELRRLFADPARPPGARLISQAAFGENVGVAIQRDFSRYLVLTLLVVLALVILVFRSPKRILLALVPVVTGLLVMFGVMGRLGIPFNLFNIVATVLVIGLCVDYGIFMVGKTAGENDDSADLSVLVSGLTTLAGFGVLVLARHPSLHSIGVTVLLGIGAAIPAALLVIPALQRKRQ